jgi:hypothetical protein
MVNCYYNRLLKYIVFFVLKNLVYGIINNPVDLIIVKEGTYMTDIK